MGFCASGVRTLGLLSSEQVRFAATGKALELILVRKVSQL
jgi:hypothetical protein